VRELHGVLMANQLWGSDHPSLKQRAMFFDKLHAVHLDVHLEGLRLPKEVLFEIFPKELLESLPKCEQKIDPLQHGADLEYLIRQGFLGNPSKDVWAKGLSRECIKRGPVNDDFLLIRAVVKDLDRQGINAVGIFEPDPLLMELGIYDFGVDSTASDSTIATQQLDLLGIAFQALPAPDENASWENILAFKQEARDKVWSFRRFLRDVATKRQTEAEIRDDIEWSLNEYRKAMESYKLKASSSFVEVFVISPLEIIENIVKFNWSKIAKGILSVQKRKVDLLEAEMKAPGRECAYIFDAQRRFGPLRDSWPP
jgi:hypothetical protein